MMLYKDATGTSMDHVSFDDLDESDSEDNDQTDPDPDSAENQVRLSPGPMIDESIRYLIMKILVMMTRTRFPSINST